MGKNKHLSHDQKRKAKLKKRAERARKNESLAYTGDKYKTDKYAPIFFWTERGIYESYVMFDRALTDDDVEDAVERLVVQLREGLSPLPSEAEVAIIDEVGEDDFIIANIRRNWWSMAEDGLSPNREDLVGILRTILHSIDVWRVRGSQSRAYLHYIEGFMKQMRVSVRRATADFEPLPEPDEDPLLLIGRSWVMSGDQPSRAVFAHEVESLLRAGDAERVVDVCQELLGEVEDLSVVPQLQELALRGRRALRPSLE